MADEKEKLPGVRLEHRGSKMFERAGQKNVEMTVVAQINDEEVWKAVEAKFLQGFDVYTVEDFKGQILQAMKMELMEREAEVRVLKTELERKGRELELLENKLNEAQRPIQELGRRLRGETT